MSNKTTKSNNTATKVEEPVYDQKAFQTVWKQFWEESVKSPDAFLLRHLRIEMPDHYEKIRSILNSKQNDWSKDKLIRQYFKAQNMLPKAVKPTKKATNGKSKGAK